MKTSHRPHLRPRYPSFAGYQFLLSLLLMVSSLTLSSLTRAAEPLSPTEGKTVSISGVHTFTADSARNHSVNNYWIESNKGWIVIDTQWRLSDAKRSKDAIIGPMDANITHIIVTHPHSDHFGGLPILYEPGVSQLLATRITARSIRNDEHGFRKNRLADFGTDFPATLPQVDITIENDSTRIINGIPLSFKSFRSNESIDSLVVFAPSLKAIFTGDLVNNKTLPVFYQGGLDLWLEQLNELLAMVDDKDSIYPGHGKPGNAKTMINRQIDYLSFFREQIDSALQQNGSISPEANDQIIENLNRRFPDWRTSAGFKSRDALTRQNILWQLEADRVHGAQPTDASSFLDNG